MNKALKGPFIKSNNKTSKMMFHLTICLIALALFSFYKNGFIPYYNNKTNLYGMFYPLIMLLTTSLTTQITEALYVRLFLKKKGKDLIEYLKNSYGFIPGLFLGLMLPINTPTYALIFGGFMAIVVGKMLFGGFGNNIFNPALIGALFITATYSLAITNNGGYLNLYEVDTVSGATPLSNVVEGIGTYETLVSPYGNLWNFFIGTIPGSLGETSALICLIGFVYLTLTKTIKPLIPTFYISTVFVLTFIIGISNGLGIWYPLFQVLSGGLLFGAIFMATDPVTSPTTKIGQILYGLCLGLLTVTFRYLTSYPEGVMTSILTMNMLVFLLDKIGAKAKFDLKKSIIPFIVIILLMTTITINISNGYKVDTTVDKNFSIVDVKENKNKVTYTVTQKGYESTLTGEIVIEKGKVTSFEITNQNDSFYQKVEDADYINYLLKNQSDLENVDTVSGATYSSTGVLKMLQNTLKDYGENYE